MRYFICSWTANTKTHNTATGNTSFCTEGYPYTPILQRYIANHPDNNLFLIPETIIFYCIWEISEQDYNDYNGSKTNSSVDAGEQLSGSDKGEVQSDIKVQQGSNREGDGSDDAEDRPGRGGESFKLKLDKSDWNGGLDSEIP